MQKNFIEELENRATQNIENNKTKVTQLLAEVDGYMSENSLTEESILGYTKEQECVTGATKNFALLVS